MPATSACKVTYNKANAQAFQKAMEKHIDAPLTIQKSGQWRGQNADFFYNPITGLTVVTTPTLRFVTGMKLGPAQLNHLIRTGRVN